MGTAIPLHAQAGPGSEHPDLAAGVLSCGRAGGLDDL